MTEDEEDPLLLKLRQQRHKQQQADVSGVQSTDAATIKKLHVSSTNLNRVISLKATSL